MTARVAIAGLVLGCTSSVIATVVMALGLSIAFLPGTHSIEIPGLLIIAGMIGVAPATIPLAFVVGAVLYGRLMMSAKSGTNPPSFLRTVALSSCAGLLLATATLAVPAVRTFLEGIAFGYLTVLASAFIAGGSVGGLTALWVRADLSYDRRLASTTADLGPLLSGRRSDETQARYPREE